MNLSKPFLGVLALFIFLFTSTSITAQVTSFVPGSQAVNILNLEKANAESELSSLVQATPVLDTDNLQEYAAAVEEARQEYSDSKEALEFKISVSEKLLTEITNAGSGQDVVKTALVRMLEKLENSPIDEDAYAYEAQNLSPVSAVVNDYVLGLLGE